MTQHRPTPRAVMPAGGQGLVDYEPCVLCTVPPGGSLLDVFRQHGRYAAPGELLKTLRAETAEAARQRFAHIPAVVRERQPPWFV